MTRRARSSTLFPYTTLFRSGEGLRGGRLVEDFRHVDDHAERGVLGDRDGAVGDRRNGQAHRLGQHDVAERDRKSTRLNSSHEWISYAVFCLKKKKKVEIERT